MKEDKISWIISFTACFVFVAVLLFLLVGLRNRIDTSQAIQDGFLDLSLGKTVSQKFTASHNFLNMIILRFRNPGLVNNDQYRISLFSEKGEKLAEQIITGFNIGDPGEVRFQFNPVQVSKNNNYDIVIETLTSTGQTAVGVGIKRGVLQGRDSLKINDKPDDGVLTFSAYYRTMDKKTVVLESCKLLINRMANDSVFTVAWLLVLVVLGIGGMKLIPSLQKEK